MFTRDFRIWGSILVGWTLLFFIYPIIAAFILGFGIDAFLFYMLIRSLRTGVAGIAFGFHAWLFERDEHPIVFRLLVSLNGFVGIFMFGFLLVGIWKNLHDLLQGYYW